MESIKLKMMRGSLCSLSKNTARALTWPNSCWVVITKGPRHAIGCRSFFPAKTISSKPWITFKNEQDAGRTVKLVVMRIQKETWAVYMMLSLRKLKDKCGSYKIIPLRARKNSYNPKQNRTSAAAVNLENMIYILISNNFLIWDFYKILENQSKRSIHIVFAVFLFAMLSTYVKLRVWGALTSKRTWKQREIEHGFGFQVHSS